MPKSEQFSRFSLSAEELSLAFSSIGHPELGRQTLAQANLPLDDRMDDLLSSASHSLIARELCTIAKKGELIWDQTLIRAVTTLTDYDYFICINLSNKKSSLLNANVFVKKGECFTSYLNRQTQYMLEYGSYANLPSFLADALDDSLFQGESGWKDSVLRIKLQILNQALGKMNDSTITTDIFKKSGLSPENAEMLAEDITRQIARGMLLRVNANSQISLSSTEMIQRNSMLFLKGPQRTWVFEFPSVNEDADGVAFLVDQKTLNNSIKRLVA